jgi:hypothetical protein
MSEQAPETVLLSGRVEQRLQSAHIPHCLRGSAQFRIDGTALNRLYIDESGFYYKGRRLHSVEELRIAVYDLHNYWDGTTRPA